METTPLMKDEAPPPQYNPSMPPYQGPPGYQSDVHHQAPPPQVYPPEQAYPPQQPYPPPEQAYPPPPSQPYPAAPPVQHTTTVITQPVVVSSVKFSDHPVQLRCNNCQKDVITHLDYTPGALTWIIVAVLFILGFWICCLIPLCIDSLKDVNHVCPNCGSTQGSYKRL